MSRHHRSLATTKGKDTSRIANPHVVKEDLTKSRIS